MKTWKIETAVVAVILFLVNYFTDKLWSIELLASIAVLLTFGYTSIADRMAEQESLRDKPAVDCYRLLIFYYVGKELFWFAYFLLNHSYSALVGVVVFIVYPIWRRFYRAKRNDNRNRL